MRNILDEFKKTLNLKGLQGWVLPKSDRHLGEYSPPWEDRLRCITGFDGSAGMAIVLNHKQALFVDGRYTLQAPRQVDPAVFHLGVLSSAEICQWLEEHLQAGDRLGFDPWLMTPSQLKPYYNLCDKIGAHLVPTTPNPVDEVWHNRPPVAYSPVEVHPLEFSGQSWQEKCQHIQSNLLSHGADTVVLSLVDSTNWLFNVRGDDIPYNPFALSYALVPALGAPILFREIHSLTAPVRAHLTGVDIEPYDDFPQALQRLEGKVALDMASTPSAIVDILNASGRVHIVDAKDPCQLPKAKKNAIEVAGAHTAHRYDGAALAQFFLWLEGAIGQGLDEWEAQEALETYRSAQPLHRGASFATIAGYGPNGAIVHYRSQQATAAPLGRDNLFLLDSGGQYQCGTTDVTRTFCFGQPTDLQKRHYTLVLKGHLALAHTRFPRGTPGFRLDPLARQFLWNDGLDYAHGTGHGVGSYLAVHEGPQNLSLGPVPTPLEPGMIVSNEPGLYLEGQYGIRIENLQVVVESPVPGFLAFETLTRVPYATNLIEKKLLSSQELGWVNSYHTWVWDEVSPLLEGRAKGWLERATQPI